MRPYTSVKDVIRDYKLYKALFERFKTKQESLRKYIRENNLHNDVPEGIRMRIYAYRNTMRELQVELKYINKTIKRFDVESTERDIERQIRESNERMNNIKQAEVYDSDGNKYLCFGRVQKEHNEENHNVLQYYR